LKERRRQEKTSGYQSGLFEKGSSLAHVGKADVWRIEFSRKIREGKL
jgi:hypothetical protein